MFLLVGDLHAVPGELDECARILAYADDVAKQHNATIVLMGDQYDTHEIIRVEVLNFWNRAYKSIESPVIALVGNHDQAGAGAKDHAMVAHETQIRIVSSPVVIEGALFVPYIHDPKEFIEACKANPTNVVLCHATFQGARFENGIYAPGGIDPDTIPQSYVVSGHIHSPQEFSKVNYIGSPRWLTAKDERIEERHLYLFDGFELTGKRFPTSHLCSRTVSLTDTKESPAAVPQDRGYNRYLVNVYGPKEHCQERRKALEGPGVRVRTFPETLSSYKAKESDGIDKAFTSYVQSFVPPNGTPKDTLVRLATERRLLGT